MREVVVPPVAAVFSFRWHPRWRFWSRTSGAAQVVGLDAAIGVVHLRIFAEGAVGILHMPVIATRVASSFLQIIDTSVEVPELSVAAIQAWRAEHTSGHAGAFSVSISEAIEAALETAGHPEEPRIESAYPLKSSNDEFTTVRVIAFE